MLYYVIRNKEDKYLLLDSRFVHWNEMPNVQFFSTREEAQGVIDYFDKQEYNSLQDYIPLKICCFDVIWEELTE